MDMTDLMTAITYTIGKFVSMFFNLQIEAGVSIGHFLVAAAILGAVIRLIFRLVNVPGNVWASKFSSKEKEKEG